MKRLFLAVIISAAFFSMFTAAKAATLTVTNNNDAGAGSLRAAVAQANSTTEEDTIVFDAGFFNVPRTITLTSGQMAPTHPLVINGPGANLLTISGNNQSRIFFQSFSTTTLTLTNITFTGGFATQGGAIYSNNALRISNAVFTANKAVGHDITTQQNLYIAVGGAIWADDLVITDSTLTNNQALGAIIPSTNPNLGDGAAGGGGGAIYGSEPVLINCLLTNNLAKGADAPTVPQGVTARGGGAAYGGAVYSEFGGIIINSTFTNNTADAGNGASLTPDSFGFAADGGDGFGGAIYSRSAYRIMNSTIAGNAASGGNGGLAPANPNVDGKGGPSAGGGIYDFDLETANITVANNTVNGGNGRVAGNGQGGGIYGGDFQWKVMSSTITGNTALAGNGTQTAGASQGGGVYSRPDHAGPPSLFHNNIISENFALAGLDVFGTFVDPFNNLVRIGDTPTAITNGVNGNQVGSFAVPREPVLGSLQNNGGLTDTRSPLAGSPVINAGNNSKTINPITSQPTNPKPLTFDQRGLLRINPAGGTIDIGAVEVGSTTIPNTTTPDLQNGSDSGGNNTDNITASTAPVFDIPDIIPGAVVDLMRNGTVVASGIGSAFNFKATLTDPNPPADGPAQYSSRQTIGGVTSTASAALTVTFDHTPPTVTINQEASQADPTNVLPIRFTVVASEPVSGNIVQNLSFAGSTADMSTAFILIDGIGNNTYTIRITAINSPGIIRLSIPPGTVFDLVNNPNTAPSTSTDNSVTLTANVIPATITGRVTRQSRRITSPTTVTIRDNFTGESWTTRTNPFGYFRLVNVPVYQTIGRRFSVSITNKSFIYNPQQVLIAAGNVVDIPFSVP